MASSFRSVGSMNVVVVERSTYSYVHSTGEGKQQVIPMTFTASRGKKGTEIIRIFEKGVGRPVVS